MKGPASILITAALAASAVADDGPEALLEQARCGMCHQIDTAMLGPSYQSVAERYRGQEGAMDEVVTRMREGSQGLWGQAPMPPVTEAVLSDEDLRTVVEWVLGR